MNDFNYDNEIIEISSDDTEKEEVVEELKLEREPKKELKKKKNKRNIKDIWKGLSKKNKTLIVIGAVVLILVIVFLVLYFTVFKKDEEEAINEPVIIEKENYRYEDGKLIFLDKNDKEIGTYICKTKDSEKCFVAKLDYSRDTFERVKKINENGDELETASKIYLNNYVFVNDNNSIVLYDIDNGEELLEVDSIKSYDTTENVVVIEKDSKYGLIEITDTGFEYLIRCSYDNLGVVNTEIVLLVAQDEDNTYVIDRTGKELSEDINADVQSVNGEFIVAKQNGTYSLYSYDYEELLSDYDYIALHDNVISLVKSNRLYLRNFNLSKLSEEGVRLENSNYVKEYVYDENNKLIETKKSYEIKVKDNVVTITTGSDTEEINMSEGEASSTLSYMSYYDGKLFFYSDEEKEDLIGTYTCQNKNNLKNADSGLTNCNIYNNSTGISGIYNNEYVFIYDNANTTESIVYLYNIREKSKKGTYSSIEILNAQELNTNIKQNYTSSSFIIAKSATGSNKGNYGVLEITGEKVVGKIEFKYESITKVKNYYLLINIDKSYSIYDTSFTKVSNEFDYIEVFDNYYVGIKDKKLNVYKFDNALGVLESDLTVTSNEFEIDFENGFNITIDGITYNYGVDGKVIEGDTTNEE